MKPLAIDLFCGLGGWTEGLLAEGYYVVGFDIERHQYGDAKYPAQLVLQDVLTLHGSQFRDAALIVASPPCQEFSYMAMPWSKAKAKRAAILADPAERKRLTALFDACFRIQREAIEAAGHFIPLVVENVRGANEWVGRSRWNYGSFHLWGDVPALMPMTKAIKNNGGSWFNIANNTTSGHGQNPDGRKVPSFRFDGSGRSFQSASVEQTGHKTHGMNWSNRELRGQDFTRIAGQQAEGMKTLGHANIRDGHSHTRHLTNQAESDGLKVPGINLSQVGFNVAAAQRYRADQSTKNGGDWFGSGENCSLQRKASSKSDSRKAASAAIAKIPFALAQHIARSWKPIGG